MKDIYVVRDEMGKRVQFKTKDEAIRYMFKNHYIFHRDVYDSKRNEDEFTMEDILKYFEEYCHFRYNEEECETILEDIEFIEKMNHFIIRDDNKDYYILYEQTEAQVHLIDDFRSVLDIILDNEYVNTDKDFEKMKFIIKEVFKNNPCLFNYRNDVISIIRDNNIEIIINLKTEGYQEDEAIFILEKIII